MMVLNAGLYRMAGVSSLGSFLPFGNANDQVEHLLRTQIMPRQKNVPIVTGVMTNDPTLSLDSRLKRLKDLGIARAVQCFNLLLHNNLRLLNSLGETRDGRMM
ncbi:MAG: phosphoenolpyruvate hydrolase family protein, partial [bacterium]|nr:phosphoenolpyruvate hydrolase family protein [bacterium]